MFWTHLSLEVIFSPREVDCVVLSVRKASLKRQKSVIFGCSSFVAFRRKLLEHLSLFSETRAAEVSPFSKKRPNAFLSTGRVFRSRFVRFRLSEVSLPSFRSCFSCFNRRRRRRPSSTFLAFSSKKVDILLDQRKANVGCMIEIRLSTSLEFIRNFVSRRIPPPPTFCVGEKKVSFCRKIDFLNLERTFY